MDTQARTKYGETLSGRKVRRPSAVGERVKHETEYDSENPKRKKLIAEAAAAHHRLTIPMRKPAPGK
jgi:hypothetical protein